MKKLFMIIAMSLMVSSMAFAQQDSVARQHKPMDKTMMVKMRTERMVKELGLDATQADSLLALNTEYASILRGRPMRMPAMRKDVAPQDSTKGTKFRQMMMENRTAMQNYENRLKGLLNAEQFKKYEEQKTKMRRPPMRRPGMNFQDRKTQMPGGSTQQNNEAND